MACCSCECLPCVLIRSCRMRCIRPFSWLKTIHKLVQAAHRGPDMCRSRKKELTA